MQFDRHGNQIWYAARTLLDYQHPATPSPRYLHRAVQCHGRQERLPATPTATTPAPSHRARTPGNMGATRNLAIGTLRAEAWTRIVDGLRTIAENHLNPLPGLRPVLHRRAAAPGTVRVLRAAAQAGHPARPGRRHLRRLRLAAGHLRLRGLRDRGQALRTRPVRPVQPTTAGRGAAGRARWPGPGRAAAGAGSDLRGLRPEIGAQLAVAYREYGAWPLCGTGAGPDPGRILT